MNLDQTTSEQLKTLYANANKDVQSYLLTDELDGAVAVFGKSYRIPVSLYLSLKNTITLILLGAIPTDQAVDALQKNCQMSASDAYSLAKDLDQTVFEKVRLSVLGKDISGVKKIELGDDSEKKEELRKEILDTTKRPAEGKPSSAILGFSLEPGSRSHLLEQLQVLDQIPDEEEVAERLEKIKSQIASIEKKVDTHALDQTSLRPEVELSGTGDKVASVAKRPATYSKPPDAYNVDPYREVVEE